MTDTRFSSAIHIMILISEAGTIMSSESIAKSVGNNPSYIRKITSLLKKRGLITSRQGVKGYTIGRKPENISLYDIYQAIADTDEVHVFDIHRNPSDRCIVGMHIQPVLTETFRGIEEKAERELKQATLADCISKLQGEIETEKEKQYE